MSPLTSIPGLLITLAGVSTGAVGLAWLMTLLLHRKSAALRHLFWLLALSAPLLALPLGLMHARIAIPILPHSLELASTHGFASQSEIAPPSSAFNNGDQISAAATPALSTTPVARHEFVLPFSPWITVWFFGAVGIIVRILFSQMRVRRLIQNSCSPGPEALMLRLNRTKQHFRLTRSVRLMVTPLTEIPFCHGVFQPTVIFPESWQEWDDERTEVCLTHEMAHIVRGDLLAMALAQVTCILCWFNPLVWFAASKLRDEAENSADDLVLARNIRPESYAANLVAITEKYRASALSPTIALSMARPNRLKSRVEAILDSTLFRKAPSFRVIFCTGLLAAIALIAGMNVRLTAAPVAPDPAKKASADAQSHLKEAVFKDDVTTVRKLIAQGVNLNARYGDNGNVPLFSARSAAMVDFLIGHGADPKLKSNSGNDALDYVGSLDPSVFDALLRGGVPFDVQTNGPDKLQDASSLGNIPLMTKLLALGVDPNKPGVWGREGAKVWLMTPLNAAVNYGREKAVTLLLDHGAKTEGDKAKIMVIAVESHPAIAKLLWSRGNRNVSPLTYAISQGASAADITKLLDQGSPAGPPQDDTITPLGYVAQKGNLDLVKLLIARGADVNKSSFHSAMESDAPVALAAFNGQDEVIGYLLAHCAKPDPAALYEAAHNSTPYQNERTHEHFEKTVRLLLDAGALKNATPEEQGYIVYGPIWTRQGPPNATVLKMILDAGANPNAPMPFTAENGEKPNTVIGYYRDYCAQHKEDPAFGTGWEKIQPLLEMLEAAAKNSTSMGEGKDPLTVRTFLIPYGFFKAKSSDTLDVKQELIGHGIEFSSDATVTFLPMQNKLVARNTPEQLDKIATLIESFPDPTAIPKIDLASVPQPDATVSLPPAAIDTNHQNPALDKALLDIARDGRTDKVGKGDGDKIGQLLDQGADPNAKDERGTSALVWALNFGKDDAAQLLIQHGADGSAEDSNGENAAWLAAKIYYCPGALDLMIKKGVKVTGLNKRGRTIFESMMSVGPAGPNKWNYLHDRAWTEAEYQAWLQREHRTVDLLIAAGVDFNGKEGSETPLMSAIKSGHYEMARVLVDHGAKLDLKDGRGNVAMGYFFLSGTRPLPLDLLETMLKRGCDPNAPYFPYTDGTPQRSSYLTAVISEAPVRSPQEIANHAFSNIINEVGINEAVQLLIDYGAAPSFKDRQGETPISLARKRLPECVPTLEAHVK